MPGKKRRQREEKAAGIKRRRARIAVAVLLSLLAAWTILAAYSGTLDSALSRKGRTIQTVSIESMNATSPSKEYIYAGARLIATEEGSGVKPLSDFDGDGKADLIFYRNGLWGILKSSQSYNTGNAQYFSWGGTGLPPVMADFDGDGKADIGYIVPPSGGQSAVYAILLSSKNYGFALGQPLFVPAGWPSLGDTPIVADFDGDGRADPAIWRSSAGTWIIPTSLSNYSSYLFFNWGQSDDVPIAADFDGDGKADIGFYRNGLWGILLSTQNYTGAQWFSWGGMGLQPVVADFDGDGKADIGYIVPPSGGQSAVYAILLSSRGYGFAPGQPLFVSAGYPSLGDTPVIADYDGDGKADPGTFRSSNGVGVWSIPKSTTNYVSYLFSQWQLQGDIPMPNKTNQY